MNEQESFALERVRNALRQGADGELKNLSLNLLRQAAKYKYGYDFNWLGRPIIQLPQDTVAMQEIIWQVQPDLIIETGIAHGGSVIFSASMLELNAACGGTADATVLGIDIDIRSHDRKAIEEHPMFKRITMLEGSSTAPEIVKRVQETANNKNKVLVCLDSNHTHDHVLAELEAYAPLTSVGSYCVVFDTLVDDMPDDMFLNRPWGKGNNPKTAVWEYLRRLEHESSIAADGAPLRFEIDKMIEYKLLITVAPDGYLKRVR